MDPLSVAASTIAIGQAASAIAVGVRALKSLANGPTEFRELLTDISAFEVVLEVTRASIEAMQTLGPQMPAQSFAGLQALQRELAQCTEDIDRFTKRMTFASDGLDKKGQYRIPRLRWLREKDDIAKLRRRVQHLHLGLSTCLAAVGATQG